MSKIKHCYFYDTKKQYLFRQSASICAFSGDSSWVILSEIEQRIKAKIEAIGTPLKEWGINIYRGILTGYNEAFIIDKHKRDELIAEDPKSAEIIRPILRGRDIKKYGYDFADLWLINVHNGIKEKGITPIKIDDYPAIKKHLDNFYVQLAKRTDKGDTPYNLRNCAYMDDFFRQKIIYPEITKFLNFYLDDVHFVTNNKCFILTGEKLNFLTAFFNSSLFKYCFKDNFPELLGGTRELRKVFLEGIPILRINEESDKLFENLLNKWKELKNASKQTTDLEQQIDNMIFQLYDLTAEEINEIGFIDI
ncbi:TaqI-like C-terminal specificity domain-containing protein [Olivibacter jilunii]|uniref:TaqI-like C-terminal specificity domain-containing protein n=1 Tax=Olivibacter jilunii TaxID=985016 RepID=UPI001A9340C2|nr:TaqI-like C-terminal specificity domain-containing protein [Olivibacter jilunii]